VDVVTEGQLLCLGIESTAHTLGMSITSSTGEILHDTKATYVPPPGRGIHPREAAQHHGEAAPAVLDRLLTQSRVDVEAIRVIAFSAGPGLGPSLRTGATIARALAVWLETPLVPVHHAIGHIELACLTTGALNPLTVLASGGHTTITAFSDGFWRVFGETEDITLGSLLEKFAREVGLARPGDWGAASVEDLAEKGEQFIDLPYVVKGNDVSYSGLLTAAVRAYQEGTRIEDLCHSLQEVAFAMLTEAVERALAHTEHHELLLTGGVAANQRLRRMLELIARDHDARFYVIPREYSGDCGAQIAWTGIRAYQAGVQVNVEESRVKPRWRLDAVPVPWR
jgi:N6-L-threonylcarbamoyladenine synthase